LTLFLFKASLQGLLAKASTKKIRVIACCRRSADHERDHWLMSAVETNTQQIKGVFASATAISRLHSVNLRTSLREVDVKLHRVKGLR